jgi:hypothetical protein
MEPEETNLPHNNDDEASFANPGDRQDDHYSLPSDEIIKAVNQVHHLLVKGGMKTLAREWNNLFGYSGEHHSNRIWKSSDIRVLMISLSQLGPTGIGADKLKTLWSLKDKGGETCFIAALKMEEAVDKVGDMVRFGADLESKFSYRPNEISTRYSVDSTTLNALSMCLASGKFSLARQLLQYMPNQPLQYSEEEARVLTADLGDQLNGLITTHKWIDVADALDVLNEASSIIPSDIIKNACNWEPVEQEISLLVLSLIHGAPKDLVRALMDFGAEHSDNLVKDGRYEIFDTSRKSKIVDTEGLILGISTITSAYGYRREKHKGIVQEAKQLFKTHYNIQHLYWYLDLFADCCIKNPVGDCASGAKLVGYLQNIYPPKAIERLISAAEDFNDTNYRNNRATSYNTLFREMAVMLYHPQAPKWKSEDISYLTRTITSQKQWIEEGLPLNRKTVYNWMRLGKFSHDFRTLKWDTLHPKEKKSDKVIKIDKSIIEHFGAEPISPRFADSVLGEDGSVKPRLGPGFLLKGHNCPHKCNLNNAFGVPLKVEVSPNLEIEFRRSYYRIYEPEHGILIISNSSPEFGRSCLKEPFYWLPPAEVGHYNSEAQLRLVEDEIDTNFYPVDDRRINHNSYSTDDMDYLLKQFAAVRDKYRLWKFNNDLGLAWDENQVIPELRLLGGHRSPGFKRVVETVEKLSSSSKPFMDGESLVDLAFCDTRMPPWFPLQFKVGNRQRTRIPVTPRVLEALKNIVSADSPGEEYAEDFQVAGLREFFEFGLNSGRFVELVILDSAFGRE